MQFFGGYVLKNLPSSVETHPGCPFVFFIAEDHTMASGTLVGCHHSPVEGYLDYFQTLAIGNKAAMYICIRVFVWI